MRVAGRSGHVTSPVPRPVIDISLWRLLSVKGRQIWSFDQEGVSGRDANFIERHALGLDTVSTL